MEIEKDINNLTYNAVTIGLQTKKARHFISRN